MTSRDMTKYTSSLASAPGHTQLDLPGGLTTDPSGPEVAPANPSPSPVGGRGSMIHGIYGLTSIASSVHPGPLSSWESKLRERLVMLGSLEWDLTWRRKSMPGGRSISRLAASVRRTSGAGCTGWPTPDASVAQDGERPETWLARRKRLKQTANNGNGCGTPLAMAVQPEICGWRTPTVQSPNAMRGKGQDMTKRLEQGHTVNLQDEAYTLAHSGTPGNSSDPTRKASTGALNPEFVCWLQGFPPEWLNSAPSATRSARNLRRKS